MTVDDMPGALFRGFPCNAGLQATVINGGFTVDVSSYAYRTPGAQPGAHPEPLGFDVRIDPVDGAPATTYVMAQRPAYFSTTILASLSAETDRAPQSPQKIDAVVALNNDLAELHDLDDGWLDGDGAIISRFAIGKAKRRLGAWLNNGAAPAHIFPTVDGGVQAQWSSDVRVVTISFSPDGAVKLYMKDRGSREGTRILLEPADPAGDAQL